MKFQFIIEADSKRLVLIPENQGEATMLGTICDPNALGDRNDMKSAMIECVPTADRAPYRKVKELHIKL